MEKSKLGKLLRKICKYSPLSAFINPERFERLSDYIEDYKRLGYEAGIRCDPYQFSDSPDMGGRVMVFPFRRNLRLQIMFDPIHPKGSIYSANFRLQDLIAKEELSRLSPNEIDRKSENRLFQKARSIAKEFQMEGVKTMIDRSKWEHSPFYMPCSFDF